MKEIVEKAGGLYLSDEVQTGFGRIGSHYWGCDMIDVKPDIITMAKQMGNGFPLAALATTKEISSSLEEGKVTFSTYGGNPIAMAVGREVLKVIDDEMLQQNSLERGEQLLNGLKELQKMYQCIGDVRGKGLMIGMEIVKDQESKEPDTEFLSKIFENTKNHGALFGKGGRCGNVFRIQPPMCLNAADVDFALDVFERSIQEAYTQ